MYLSILGLCPAQSSLPSSFLISFMISHTSSIFSIYILLVFCLQIPPISRGKQKIPFSFLFSPTTPICIFLSKLLQRISYFLTSLPLRLSVAITPASRDFLLLSCLIYPTPAESLCGFLHSTLSFSSSSLLMLGFPRILLTLDFFLTHTLFWEYLSNLTVLTACCK